MCGRVLSSVVDRVSFTMLATLGNFRVHRTIRYFRIEHCEGSERKLCPVPLGGRLQSLGGRLQSCVLCPEPLETSVLDSVPLEGSRRYPFNTCPVL